MGLNRTSHLYRAFVGRNGAGGAGRAVLCQCLCQRAIFVRDAVRADAEGQRLDHDLAFDIFFLSFLLLIFCLFCLGERLDHDLVFLLMHACVLCARMCVYVDAHVCVCARICVYMHACVYACARTRAYAHAKTTANS